MTIFTGRKNLSAATIFFTIISGILGAVFFLRLGYSVGMLGFIGTISLIIIAHIVVIPTALALSEISTNQRIEGQDEYYILSRTFGLNIGAVIGIGLYLCQTIGIAFYIVAITEAFTPLLHFIKLDGIWGRPIVSILVFIFVNYLSFRKRSLLNIKTLLVVILILIIALLFFFLGKSNSGEMIDKDLISFRMGNISDSFFVVFSLIFPAFAGILYGLRLMGQVRKPGDTLPKGIMVATITGVIVYCLIAFKLASSVIDSDLVDDQLIMGKISLGGPVIIPLVIIATAFFSAMISIMSAPATLQSLAIDGSLPIKRLNTLLSKNKGKNKISANSIYVTNIIAFFFVLKGEFNFMAQILTMLYLLVFGSICLVSFLNDFGANPSYRPIFRSRWYISLIGFIFSVWILFEIHPFYAFISFVVVILLYQIVSFSYPDRGNFAILFRSAVFRLNRKIQLYLQKGNKEKIWRPSAVCLTSDTFENDKALKLLNWISYRYGFGTYIHLIEDQLTIASNEKAKETLNKLVETAGGKNYAYLSTLISPSFSSALSQIVQLPLISGISNNMIVFVHDKLYGNLHKLKDNITLAKAASLDVCVFVSTNQHTVFNGGIHVWIKSENIDIANLIINISYILLAHPDWKNSKIKFFSLVQNDKLELERKKLTDLTKRGILTLSLNSIEIIKEEENQDSINLINEKSKNAGLTIIGFDEEEIKFDYNIFNSYNIIGDLLFVNSKVLKENI